MFKRALSLILSPVKSVPAVSPEKAQRDATARKVLALFDVPISRVLPSTLFESADEKTKE